MTSLIFHLFVVVLSRIAKGGDCQDIYDLMLGTYVKIKLANLLTKHTLLVIGQIQDVFNTSKNKSSSLVLKPCKSIQETSEEGLFIKAGQIPDKQQSIEVSTATRQILSIEVLTAKKNAGLCLSHEIKSFDLKNIKSIFLRTKKWFLITEKSDLFFICFKRMKKIF